MTSGELTRADPLDVPSIGSSRARILALVSDAAAPVGVSEVAAEVGLHANTVRFHLDGLVEQGFAERGSEDRGAPGRPRFLYTPVAGRVPAGRRSYRVLAEILSGGLAHTEDPRQAALHAGESWGRALVDPAPSAVTVDRPTAAHHLTQALEEIGFAPEVVRRGTEQQILLRHCPFRETAERHPEVVCSVHLGLMRGVLAGLGAPQEVAGLDSFVEPELCVAHLT